MLLEAGVIVLGLVGGFRAGIDARVEALQRRVDVEEEDAAASGAASQQRRRRRAGPASEVEATITVMLVGERRVGKTLFCSRLVCESDRAAMAAAERAPTFSPTWRRVDVDLPLEEGPEAHTCPSPTSAAPPRRMRPV